MNKNSAAQQAWLLSMNVGKESFQCGRMNDAVNAFTQATKLLPTRVESWINLGSALLEARRFQASAAALDKAIALNPKVMASHMLLGDALRQLGEFRLALTSYRNAVSLQRQPLALNKLACALRAEGEMQEASDLYHEAVRLDPRFTLARVNLATLDIERGQFDAARAQLDELAARPLPAIEREEVNSSQRALSEYFRLNEAITHLSAQRDPAPLQAALEHAPAQVLQVDEGALRTIRLYIESARRLDGAAATSAATTPPNWPLIEAMFMIPLVDSVDDFLRNRPTLGQTATGALLETVNMEPAIVAARVCQLDMQDPVKAELHLRHWHALACADVTGFQPGHFKYTQNWTTRSPTLKRVDPALASGTFRHFISEMYPAVPPGLPRAAVVWMAVCDLHPFADGNGRVALTWLNRELEWAGLMPALFRRDLGLKGELGNALKEARINGGDLSPLLAAITKAQHYAGEFCAALANR